MIEDTKIFKKHIINNIKGGAIDMRKYILAINPGSTSTKVAVFEGVNNVKQKNLSHSTEEISKFEKIAEQYSYRENAILDWLKDEGIALNELAAVVGRGGLLRPMPSGTYRVTDALIHDLTIGAQYEHASNLGGLIARAIAESEGIEAFIVDPVAVDEYEDIARISGMPELPRRSLVHALNVKAVARRVAKGMNKNVEEVNFIVAHLGGGITISPMKAGKIVDANNANEGGPFSPERCGGVPVGELVKIAFSGKYTEKELKKKMLCNGGLVGYLNTNDVRHVQTMIEKGDNYAELIFNAMGYQIAKEIGACAAVLCGKVDKIIITGGMAYSNKLMEYIEDMIKFIAPVEIVPGEDEMQALADGAFRVLNGEENSKIYEEEVH